MSMEALEKHPTIAVIIPSYKVTAHILEVLNRIPDYVSAIYVVDDECPDESGKLVEKSTKDPRVKVLYNSKNLGVGGAVMHGYKVAIEDGYKILVKVDGDGQMDPSLIKNFTRPIAEGYSDYTKGNRFFSNASVKAMPKLRLFGNIGLSFFTKLSSGYWNIQDPTNGYTAIHANIASVLEFDKISRRYFFESDMLYNLGIVRAQVTDIPIISFYGDEESNLKISKIFSTFLFRNTKNSLKRIIYQYFLRGFSLASVFLILAIVLLLIGTCLAIYIAIHSNVTGLPTSTGGLLAISLLLLFGLQFLTTFFANDLSSEPSTAIHPFLSIFPKQPLSQSGANSNNISTNSNPHD